MAFQLTRPFSGTGITSITYPSVETTAEKPADCPFDISKMDLSQIMAHEFLYTDLGEDACYLKYRIGKKDVFVDDDGKYYYSENSVDMRIIFFYDDRDVCKDKELLTDEKSLSAIKVIDKYNEKIADTDLVLVELDDSLEEPIYYLYCKTPELHIALSQADAMKVTKKTGEDLLALRATINTLNEAEKVTLADDGSLAEYSVKDIILPM